MTQLIEGAVTGLSTKQITSKKTGKDYTLHYVNVEGFNDRINIGFNAKYKAGDTVKLDVEHPHQHLPVHRQHTQYDLLRSTLYPLTHRRIVSPTSQRLSQQLR